MKTIMMTRELEAENCLHRYCSTVVGEQNRGGAYVCERKRERGGKMKICDDKTREKYQNHERTTPVDFSVHIPQFTFLMSVSSFFSLSDFLIFVFSFQFFLHFECLCFVAVKNEIFFCLFAYSFNIFPFLFGHTAKFKNKSKQESGALFVPCHRRCQLVWHSV